MWLFLVIFCLLFIYFFADYLPVFSCVLWVNSLIINTIHLSGLHAFSRGFYGGVGGNVCFDEREVIS